MTEASLLRTLTGVSTLKTCIYYTNKICLDMSSNKNSDSHYFDQKSNHSWVHSQETESNGEQSDMGIDNSTHNYHLQVIPSRQSGKPERALSNLGRSKWTLLPPINNFKRGDSLINKWEKVNKLDNPLGKEFAMHYLKRQNENTSPYFRINSMATNANSLEDFKKDLLNWLNVPAHFKRRNQLKMIKRSQSLPKASCHRRTVSDGKKLLWGLIIYPSFLILLHSFIINLINFSK